jgi:uncharacterized protein involved in outer membrane biogenesis
MKKLFLILTIILVVVIGTLVALPILFKDDIRSAIDSEISKNIEADVYFDESKIGISIIKNFPNITLTLEDFGIVGSGVFKEDTLAAIDAFDITLDLKSLLSGNQIKVNSINLINPRIVILVNENGEANYDIMIEKETEVVEVQKEKDAGMEISVDKWNIGNGKIVYYDYASNLLMALDGLNHTGSGDFSLEVFDISTNTSIDRMMASYNDVEYLKNKALKADLILHVDMVKNQYSFGQNTISINDFNFGFEGFLEVLSDHYNIDISYHGIDNSVKSILSLIPKAYSQDFKDIQAEGNLDFHGAVKGMYSESENEKPSFNLRMSTKNGRIQYPDLPEALDNIRFDLNIDNRTGDLEQTVVDFRDLHFEIGDNPVDASLKINNLSDYDLKATINADVDLTNIMRIFPVKETELSGRIETDLVIEGVYDTVNHTIPVSGEIIVDNLYYRSEDFQQGFTIASSDVILNDRRIDVKTFEGNIGNSDLSLKGYVQNYIDYVIHKDATLVGEFDFNSEFFDVNEWLAEGSDEVNEKSESDANEDSVSASGFKIPQNIDLVLESKIKKVLYDNLELNDFAGQVVVRDGAIQFNEVGFNSLGGQFNMAGAYDTKPEDKSSFDFNLDIEKLSIPESYKHFMTVRMLAPIAEIMEGSFSSNFKLKGELGNDLSPDLSTLSGGGILKIANAAIKGSDSKVISGITNVSKLSNQSTDVSLTNVILNSEIENGRVFIQPFNVSFGDNNALIAGSNGLDGSLDYNVKLDVPQEIVNTAGSLLSSISGQDINVNSEDVKLNIKVAGDYNSPKISILGAEAGENKKAAEEALKAKVEEEKEKALVEAEKLLETEKEKAPEEVQKILDEHEEEIEKAKTRLKKFFKKDGGK